MKISNLKEPYKSLALKRTKENRWFEWDDEIESYRDPSGVKVNDEDIENFDLT